MLKDPGFSILYEDAYLVVVDKDAGLLTTPASYSRDCLVDRLEADLDTRRFGRYRLAVVHRLDRETTGLLVFSRDPRVTPLLAKQFAAHRVERSYTALAEGHLPHEFTTFREPLNGKRAVTHVTVEAHRTGVTTVTVRLETGRTNQIRRHFATAGHPLLGDRRFGSTSLWPFPGIALQARLLGFLHPVSKKMQRFEARKAPWLELI